MNENKIHKYCELCSVYTFVILYIIFAALMLVSNWTTETSLMMKILLIANITSMIVMPLHNSFSASYNLIITIGNCALTLLSQINNYHTPITKFIITSLILFALISPYNVYILVTQCSNNKKEDVLLSSSDSACSICLNGLVTDQVTTLKCKHIFHTHCISTWKNTEGSNKKCPICRNDIVSNKT